MHCILKILFVIVLFSSVHIANAQTLTSGLSGTVGIPKVLKNGVFKENFTGVFDAKIVYDYFIYKGFNIGIIGGISEFQYKFYKWATKGLQNYNYSAGLRLGYAYPTAKGFWISRMSYGNTYMKFNNVNPSTITVIKPLITVKDRASFLDVETAIYFFIDEAKNFAMGGGLGYTRYNTAFKPDDVYLRTASANTPTINAQTLKGNTQYLTLNLGFHYLILKKEKK